MFLATLDILGPIARMSVLVVQKSTDAQLFGRCAVPASPVTGARRLVAEYSVQPVTVLTGDGSVYEKHTTMRTNKSLNIVISDVDSGISCEYNLIASLRLTVQPNQSLVNGV